MPFTLYALYLRQKQLFSYLVYEHIRTVSGTLCTVFGTRDGCNILIQMISLFSSVGSIYYDIVNGGPFINLSLFPIVVNLYYTQAI